MDDRTVGVRELRQHLSVYLRRVAAGETLRVTDRGTPVALLAPLPERADPLGRLVAEGRLTAPLTPSPALRVPPSRAVLMPISEALQRQRSE